MAFSGFPEEAIEFYEGLEADNSKAYWTDHKSVYDDAVAGPMKELLAELAPTFGEAKMFRPYRDVRFSKDKTPYKTRQYAVVHTGDQGLYLGIDAQGLHLGGGMFQPATEQVKKLREAVAGWRSCSRGCARRATRSAATSSSACPSPGTTRTRAPSCSSTSRSSAGSTTRRRSGCTPLRRRLRS